MSGVLRTAGGAALCARCEVAETPFARMRGLLGRASLAEDEGMLFRPAGSVHTAFMRFPIDVVFCDGGLAVVGVEHSLRPWRAAGRRGAKVVIELAAGAASDIETGDLLAFEKNAQESSRTQLFPTVNPLAAKGGATHMDLRTWINLLRAAAQREEGQTMAEYGVVLAVITLGVIVALGALALAITGKLDAVTAKLNLP
jgi:uncharacterized membrane protein (UPF0127 family)/Flp pilus assembly pilin Flp